MINPTQISDQEYERLAKAKETRKYGHLETWKELYMFQRTIANPTQVREISGFAGRKNKGQDITLPLKDCKNL